MKQDFQKLILGYRASKTKIFYYMVLFKNQCYIKKIKFRETFMMNQFLIFSWLMVKERKVFYMM
jgi:hypothetical protein